MKRLAGLLRRLADRLDPQPKPRPWVPYTANLMTNTTTCANPVLTTIPILYSYPPERVT